MTNVTNSNKLNTTAGGPAMGGPRPVGDIIAEMLGNDESLFKTIYPNTEFCVDLKFLTREPGRMAKGAYLGGVITRDGDDHFTFVQNAYERKVGATPAPRNPHVYHGARINVHSKADGTLYPTFTRPCYSPELSFCDFCREAAAELLAVAGLGGEAYVTD